jgi:flagellar biosynthesis/type III secretory pathway protein FliH
MTQLKKFSFDLSFAEEDMARHSPKYSENDKELLTKSAYDAGYAKGIEDTLEGIHSRNETQLYVLTEHLNTLIAWHEKLFSRLEEEIALIVKKIAQTLFPATANQVAIPELLNALEALKEEFKKHPEITLYTHPDTLGGLKEKCASLEKEFFSKAAFIFEKDEELPLTDMRIAWAGGGVIYQHEHSFQRIYEALERYGMERHLIKTENENLENNETLENNDEGDNQ